MKEYETYRDKMMDDKKSQMGEGELNERIRTYNWPDDRVTDHRLGKTIRGVEKIIYGNALENFIEELIKIDHSKQLDLMLKD